MGLEGLIGKGPPQKTHFRYVEPQELVPAVMTGGQLTEANRKFNRSVVGKSKLHGNMNFDGSRNAVNQDEIDTRLVDRTVEVIRDKIYQKGPRMA